MPDDVSADEMNDPFWSVVHRRHPDLDIVLLPPERPAPAMSGLPERAPGPFAQLQLTDADDLWRMLVGHGMPRREARWIPGPTRDSVRHAITLTLAGVGTPAGIEHLREARGVLTADGWHLFIPPTGTPRIMADRAGELGAEELLAGFDAEHGRLFIRLTSTGLPVGVDRARELIGAAA